MFYIGCMTKNKGGRPKGRKNHIDTKTREVIRGLFEHKFTPAEVTRLIDAVEREEGPKKAFDCYVALADFVLPKLARVEHTGKDGDKLSIEHVLNTLQAPDHHMTQLPEPDNSDVIDITPEKSPDKVD